ncbi:hypothetical protein ASPACDRAFT_58234 [Aspergillus aculeatus ATCC 16872]|uniref:CENP-C homolog n=1 Tax=Aspergillus aculeatus (strain ATCC 16872 / CBS 172.66 / WB 5094) TaxID=690307 RepID=A0A1L9X4B7_ASPA1|nr:uncharacterized protein ASPACDRAFT_58234 [Aspergillus aculeatus ATCC 16872]OJK03307.1 hypothetical protein ASPACDRAFT_58234 [Aspergillus aculeatus ATCC 16872]
MAPRGPSKARDYDYANVGKAGRRTGIILKEGRRDEFGMEEVDGIFSSPESSPTRDNGFGIRNEASVGSDGMSMDEGTSPGPADYLNSRRGSYLPPPVARSPMKTGLTGSPRRTPGLRSSQSPQRNHLSSSPSDGKGLGIAKSESWRDISPLTNRSANATPSMNHLHSARISKKTEIVAQQLISQGYSDSDTSIQSSGDENADVLRQEHDAVESIHADEDVLTQDPIDDLNLDEARPESPFILAPKARTKGRPKASFMANVDGIRQKLHNQDASDVSDIVQADATQKRKRPGRPPMSQHSAAHDMIEQRPIKKPRVNAQTGRRSSSSGDAELDKVVENYINRTGPLRGRSLYVLKREAPSDDTATHTRSGRVSVRPLAYWRNERCVYGDGEAIEGQRFPLSTIKEIIRTEELEPEQSHSGKRRPSKKSRAKQSRVEDSDEDAAYLDPWEKKGGILHGYVRMWDSESQTATESDIVDLAYAPSGMETKSVKDSSWRFAKLISSPFMGSGIVELPPGGVKKPKNSKKMHMVFYICNGRVQVDVSGVRFSAGKGCVFQVPRGNYYSFANTHNKDARLFFTQGCLPENDDSAPGSATKAGIMEADSSTPTGRSTTTGKGRPRGKQKIGPGRKAK